MDFLHANGSPVSGGFDIKNLWSNDMTFSESGKVLCGKAFPRSDSIRFVTDALAQKDFNDANKDELDAMPSKWNLLYLSLCFVLLIATIFFFFLYSFVLLSVS